MWQQLFRDTIFAPKVAARQLLATRVNGGDIWAALALATILNAIVFILTVMLSPAGTPQLFQLISPFSMALMFFASMTIGAWTVYIGGKPLSGAASFYDILKLVTWLQYMRLAVQLAGLVLILLIPTFATLLTFAAMLYGVWILLNFVNEAQGYDSFGKTFANLMIGFLGLTIVFSIFASFFGLGA